MRNTIARTKIKQLYHRKYEIDDTNRLFFGHEIRNEKSEKCQKTVLI